MTDASSFLDRKATHEEMILQLGQAAYAKFWQKNPNRDFEDTPTVRQVIALFKRTSKTA